MLKTIFQIEIHSRLFEFVLAAVVSKIFSTSESTDGTYWIEMANNILIRVFKSEVESRTQDSRPRPSTLKNPKSRSRTVLPKTPSRGQGLEHSRPRLRTKDTTWK